MTETLKNEHIGTQVQPGSFSAGLLEIGNYHLPAVIALAVIKNSKRVQAELTTLTQLRYQLLKKYADTNESGEIETDANGAATFERDEDVEAFRKEFDGVMSTNADIEIVVVPASLFVEHDVEIQPRLLMAIAPMLDMDA